MKVKTTNSFYAFQRNESYEWSVEYCREKNYTQMLNMTGRSVTRNYQMFYQCIIEDGQDGKSIRSHMGYRLNETLDAKYHLHLHELVVE